MSSPQAWGCFYTAEHKVSFSYVFPTGVGVFLLSIFSRYERYCLPHRRGGVSTFPPRCQEKKQVFPTGVGVFLVIFMVNCARKGLPHRRGGVSVVYCRVTVYRRSSPQAWGCFRYLHLQLINQQSSPQAWGCFCQPGEGKESLCVFPTGVGVFLYCILLLLEEC